MRPYIYRLFVFLFKEGENFMTTIINIISIITDISYIFSNLNNYNYYN